MSRNRPPDTFLHPSSGTGFVLKKFRLIGVPKMTEVPEAGAHSIVACTGHAATRPSTWDRHRLPTQYCANPCGINHTWAATATPATRQRHGIKYTIFKAAAACLCMTLKLAMLHAWPAQSRIWLSHSRSACLKKMCVHLSCCASTPGDMLKGSGRGRLYFTTFTAKKKLANMELI